MDGSNLPSLRRLAEPTLVTPLLKIVRTGGSQDVVSPPLSPPLSYASSKSIDPGRIWLPRMAVRLILLQMKEEMLMGTPVKPMVKPLSCKTCSSSSLSCQERVRNGRAESPMHRYCPEGIIMIIRGVTLLGMAQISVSRSAGVDRLPLGLRLGHLQAFKASSH